MKKLLLILFIPVYINAQTVSVQKDDFDESILISTTPYAGNKLKVSDNIAEKGVIYFAANFMLPKNKTEIYGFTITFDNQYNGINCISEDSGKVILLLEDGSKIECKQASKTTCDRSFLTGVYILAEKPEEIITSSERALLLTAHKITKIRISTSEYNQDYAVKADKQEIIQNHFKKVYLESLSYTDK